MSTAIDSLIEARNNMVDGQLRPNKVSERRILDAMRRLPREDFVPASSRALAYADAEVPLGGGRVLLAPLITARLIQAASVPERGRVLVLGAGYAAAIFAACGVEVIALEPDPEMRVLAAAGFAACGATVAVVSGPMATGWAAAAPYDCIFIDGAVRRLPGLGAQLRRNPPGRLCGVVAPSGRNGVGVVAEMAGDGLAQRPIFDCAATLLPAFEAPAAFQF